MLELAPENMATLAAATVGIGAITLGSKQLSDPETATSGKLKIMLGGAAMCYTAYTGDDPRYLLPELLIVATGAKSYLESQFEVIKTQTDKISKGLERGLITAAAVGIMTKLILDGDISGTQEALAPTGLLALGIAFGLNPQTDKEQLIYRLLSNSGAAILVAGSGLDLKDALDAQNNTGAVMSGAFLGLNLVFLVSEAAELYKKYRNKVQTTIDK